MESKKKAFSLYDIVMIGLMAAVVFVVTMFLSIRIPTPTGTTMIKLANAFVLLCGLLVGPGYGAFCGIAGPIISSTTGMPSVTQCFYMVPELAVYGLVAGLLMKYVHTKKLSLDLYISMVPAMILGRIVGGIAQMLVIRILGTGETFNIAVWAMGYFGGTLPGIISQLILLPILVMMLERARVIPRRYMAEKQV